MLAESFENTTNINLSGYTLSKMDTYKVNFTKAELEILLFLLERTGERFSQREIAQALNTSPTTITNALPQLHEHITIQKTKTANYITAKRDKKTRQLKRAANLKNIYITGLADELEEQLAGATIILFGSYSKGEDTKTSDIDIAIIGRKPKTINLEAYEKQLHRPIRIQYYQTIQEIHAELRNNILNGIILTGSIHL